MRLNDPAAVLNRWVDRTGGPNACWPWLAGKSPRGYGKARVANRDWRAHRLAYEVWVETIPVGLLVLHSCDNPSCCNPAHLRAGTHLDNQREKWSKGRGRINAYKRTRKHREAMRIRGALAATKRKRGPNGRFV